MRYYIIYIGAFLALAMRGYSADGVVDEWDAFVNGKPLKSVLSSVDKKELRQWPFIYSASCAARLPPSERRVQSGYRKTCTDLLKELYSFSTEGASASSCVVSNASALLAWRSLLYNNPSYHNLLMAEAVNRALITHLVDKALLTNTGYRVATSNIVILARESLFPVESWRIVLSQELHGDSFGELAISPHYTAESSAKACRDLWREMGKTDNILAPTNADQASISNLQEHPDISLLLHRYIKTDALIRLAQMVRDYMNRMPNASVSDSIDQISNMFPIETFSRSMLTPSGGITEHLPPKPDSSWCIEEVLSCEPFSALQVAGLLGLLDRGQLNAILYFD